MSVHISVFKKEIIENLHIDPSGVYVDLTLGGGGHALAIWEQLFDGGLIAFDVDQSAIDQFIKLAEISEQTSDYKDVRILGNGQKTLMLVNRSFSRLAETLTELQLEKVNGVIADLGWSSDQLSSIPGLAYDTDEPMELDMRLDKSMQTKASDLLNGLYRQELFTLFERYADIVGSEARKLVDAILAFRGKQPIRTNTDLLQIIDSTLPPAMRNGARTANRALPARVFQALRIAVNDELSRLQSVLPQAWNALMAEGVLEVITFHSGEDRIVKREFAKWMAEGKAEPLFAEEFLRPSVAELRDNLRARSAKLRGVKKIH